MENSRVPSIHAALNAIMGEIGAVGKDGTNQKQGYKYRSVDDVYAHAQPLFVKHGVYTTSEILSEKSQEKPSNSGGTLLYRILHIRYTFWSIEDGSCVSTDVIGEGMDSGDKASNKAMSVGHKYAICQVLCIPTSDPKDPEIDSHEVSSRAQNTQSGAVKPPYQPEAPQRTVNVSGGSPGYPNTAQLTRLFAITKAAGYEKSDVEHYISQVWGLDSTSDLSKPQYDALCGNAKKGEPSNGIIGTTGLRLKPTPMNGQPSTERRESPYGPPFHDDEIPFG